MASSLSDDPEAGRGEKHGWNSLDDYLWQHARRLDNYSGFVQENHKSEYKPVPSDNPGVSFLRIKMEIPCEGGIKLTVNKLVEIRQQRRRKIARTITYAYNASSPKGNILRYDNAHKYQGHPTEHHKHVFNGTGNEVMGSPFPVKEDNWPHMHEVIDELMKRVTQTN